MSVSPQASTVLPRALGIVKSEALFLSVLSALLVFPLFFVDVPGAAGRYLGTPRVFGGDEPHYLVLLHSILDDGDLNLKNNYMAVHDGGRQAGLRFAGSGVDHHVSYYVNGERRIWAELFYPYVHAWPRAPNGERMQVLRAGVDPHYATDPEYSAHPVGIAFLLAPLLFPFRGSEWLEPVALLLAALSTVFAMFLFRDLLKQLGVGVSAQRLTLIAVFLGTPIWYYARTFFNEPFLLLCVVGAFACAFVPSRALWAGAFIAAGMLMKPQLAALGPLLALPALRERDWKRVGLMAALPLLAFAAILFWNQRMFGSPLRGPYPFYRGDFFVGATGLLFSETHGIAVYAPMLVIGLLGVPALLKQEPLRGGQLLAAFGLFFVLTAFWKYWDGGWCFGPRLMVPFLPLLGVALAKALELPWLRKPAPQFVFVALALVSCVLSYAAVRAYWEVPGAPWKTLVTKVLSAV